LIDLAKKTFPVSESKHNRQIVSDAKGDMRRYLVIAPGDPMMPGAVVQVQK